MKTTIETEKIPLKLWLDDIEESALQQAKNLANLPFAFHHIAIMPDAHYGYGMPIGGVLATTKTVIPNGVGVDIGCGVCAVQTSLEDIEPDTLKSILGAIRQEIPTGHSHHKRKQNDGFMPSSAGEQSIDELTIVPQEYDSALHQLGTLGGGNHFIEIQKGSDHHIWVMIHSGSRNIGYKVAGYYNKLAIKLNAKWKSKVNPKWQLAYLPSESEEGLQYMQEMAFCVDFALGNRLLMMQRIEDIFSVFCCPVRFSEPINVAHNYAASEKHYKQNVIVHRKGATRAFKNETGVIPGSQGSPSFIVSGKGNSESFCSCSHGAGRKLSRKQAQKQLNLHDEIKHLDEQKILHGVRGKRDLDEAPGAYKNIHHVMKNQQDLVDIVTSLQPLAVIKG